MKKLWMGILSIVMIFAGSFALANNFVYAEEAAPNEEKKVETAQDLQNALNGNYAKITLQNDLENVVIDISQITNEFQGFFDGNGYKITNLTLGAPEDGSVQSCYGLIPRAKGATIQDLKLEGSLTYDLRNMSSTGAYIGGLVGLGDDTTIKNCEIDLTSVQEIYTETYTDEEDGVEKTRDALRDDIHLGSKVTFGMLAGRLNGKSTEKKNVEDCIAYYSTNFVLDEMASIQVGGLVGMLSQGVVVNSLNFGQITYGGKNLDIIEDVYQYFGGIVGVVDGTNTQVKNTIFGGTVAGEHDYVNFSLKAGAIIGGCPTAYTANNIRYDYYLQNAINPVGDDSIAIKANLQNLTAIDEKYTTITKDLLTSVELFDGALEAFDFNTIWDYKSAKVVLQQFEYFEFIIPEGNFEIALSSVKTIKDASFEGAAEGEAHRKIFKYGDPVTIKVTLLDDCQGWFDRLTIYQNTENVVTTEVTANELLGWSFTLEANASTAGRYSFSVEQTTPYEGLAAVLNTDEGGVRMSEAAVGSISESVSLEFRYDAKSKKIVAESKGIYAFDHWDVYYKATNETDDADGDGWEDEKQTVEDIAASELKVVFNRNAKDAFNSEYDAIEKVQQVTFNREVKLIAVFTADPANVNFTFDDKQVLLISLGGNEYNTEEAIQIAKKGIVPLRITVKKGYMLDVEALKKDIKTKVQDPLTFVFPATFQSDSILDEEGNTIYSFNIDMSKFDYAAGKEEIKIKITSKEDKNANASDLLWLWITLACVVVVATGVVVTIVVIKKRKGGGRGGRGAAKGTKAPKAKAESYKDYYV